MKYLLMTVALLAACGGDAVIATPIVPTGPKPVAAVSVAATSNNLFVGQTAKLTARAQDQTGAVLDGHTFIWSSSSDAVATVSAAGGVVGVSPGTASISATTEGKVGTLTVTVQAVGPRLVISVDGVPAGIASTPLQVKNADLSVLFNTVVVANSSLSLAALPPGQYTIMAGAVQVTVGGIGFVYLPLAAQWIQTVTVGQFATTNVAMSYGLRTGAITITATGLPAGITTACTLLFPPPGVQGIIGGGAQTPSGQPMTVQAYGTGAGTLTCNPVTVGTTVYQATPFQQPVTVQPSFTPASASVSYSAGP